MLSKETIIEQAKQIILQKKPNLNVEKFMKLDFSLLCWQTVIVNLTIHQFEDGLRQYAGSYFTLVNGEAKLQKIQIENHLVLQEWELIQDKPFFFGMEYLTNEKEFYQILATAHCTITIIKDIRIQQILKNYYSLCEFQILESLSKVYFLQQEASVFLSMLIHESQRLKYIKGQIIYKIDDKVEGFYLILEGEICVKKMVEISNQSEVTNSRKIRKKLIIQHILSKDQQFGEMDLFTNQTARNEQTECYSLECDVLFITTQSLIEAYQAKLQQPHFSLLELSEIFKEYINLKNSKSQEAISRYVQVNKPVPPPKPEMKPTDPLFMNLEPLTNFKYPDQKVQPQQNIIRTSSLYTQSQKPQNYRMPQQNVVINYTLAKMNRQEGLVPIQQYIENIKQQQLGKSGTSSYQLKKKMKQNALSVITEQQQKMIDYARQMTPIYIQKRKSVVRNSLPDVLNYNKAYMMLKPEKRN